MIIRVSKFTSSKARKFPLRLAGSLLLLCFLYGLALAQEIPQPINYVSDYAGIIDDVTEAKLNALLKELEEKTTAEVAVLTVRSTKPLNDFDYSIRVFNQWKIGEEAEDNGLLFLVVSDDRRARITTGYGLEGILPDGKVGEILDKYVIPYFKEGDYSEAIYQGSWKVAYIVAEDAGVELTGTPEFAKEPLTSPLSSTVRNIIFIVIFIVLLNMFLFRSRRFGFPMIFWWGGSGGSSFGKGGFSRGSFGGFGGGATGGGGAGRGW